MNTTLLNNRYQIISKLGRGGFGETFLAEDTQMPSRRRCVIKQLTPVTGDSQTYQLVKDRFGREAAVLEQLGEKHSQIPKLYAYFESGGEFYLVQEWIEGETLTNKLQKAGQFSDRQVRDLLTSLLPVLEFVHSHKILHRDIKPDNIMFRHRDGLPVLIDFGAVKETMNTVVTASGSGVPSIAIGTPGFMPAEQAAGRPVYSSDLYALGMTGIYLLTGKMPQELETDSRTGQLLWRNYAPQVTPNLALVLDRAIRFNPGDRYYSAQEMLKVLQPENQGNAISNMATVAVSPRNPYPPTSATTYSQQTNQQTNNGWLPITIVGVMIFSAAFAGSFAIMQNKKPPVTTTSSDTTSKPTVSDNSAWSSDSNSTGDSRGDSSDRAPKPAPIKPAPVYPETSQLPTSTSPNQSQSSTSETEAETANNPPSSEKTPPSENPSQTPPEISNIPPTPEKTLPSETPPETQPETQPETSNNSPTSEIFQPSEPSPKPSRTEAVRNYYDQINQRQYSRTWNQLSPKFQEEQSGSYKDYLDWWNQVDRVEVSRANVVESTEDTALVDTKLTYYMKTGRVSSENLQLSLIWDEQSQQWIIDKTRRY
jgi:serine/threonine-protein kinase